MSYLKSSTWQYVSFTLQYVGINPNISIFSGYGLLFASLVNFNVYSFTSPDSAVTYILISVGPAGLLLISAGILYVSIPMIVDLSLIGLASTLTSVSISVNVTTYSSSTGSNSLSQSPISVLSKSK